MAPADGASQAEDKMSFTTGIPVNGSSLATSRDPLRANLQKLRTNSEVNHFAVNGANAGKHDFVEIPKRAAVPTTLAQEGSLYTKLDANSQTQLWYTPDASGNEYQITKTFAAQFAGFSATAGATAQGWYFLPGGIIVQYGTLPIAAGQTGTITFPFPFPSVIFNIQMTPIGVLNNTAGVAVAAPALASFDYVKSNNGGFYWMAYGK